MFTTIGEAVAIVILVIIVFLGLVPLGAHPDCHDPDLADRRVLFLYVLGFSINLLSLLRHGARYRPCGGWTRSWCWRISTGISREACTPSMQPSKGMKEITGSIVANDDHAGGSVYAARIYRRPDGFSVPRIRLSRWRARSLYPVSLL
ncbi:hypothetical protein VXQ18_02055 [Brucella abortus]|nr:hypothetical protein [Brucella abortus]